MLDLQNALVDHLGVITRFVAERAWSADPKETFEWHHREQLGRGQLALLSSRVLDDQTRELVHRYMDASAAIMDASTPQTPPAARRSAD